MRMRRLRGVDGYLWYNETPSNHMHTLKVAILDTARASVPYSAQQFTRDLDDRLHLIPSFRWRLLETPMGLHHPVWVEDRDFDITRHVFRTLAKPPGGPRQRDEVIALIAQTPLPRDRPLWQLHLVEGLAGGQVAAVAKIHHAMADGGAAANQLLSVADDPIAKGMPAPITLWSPPPPPSRRALLTEALHAHPARARRLPDLVRRTHRGWRAMRQYWRDNGGAPTRPFSGPRTFLNGTIDHRRTFASTPIAFDDVNALRRGTDYTVNDLVLAIATGALRRLLADHGGLPDEPLVANVPAATGQRTDRLYGNSVGILFIALPVHLTDQRLRLRLIHDAMRAAREANERLGPELFEEWLDYVPPKLFSYAAKAYARSKLVARRRPMMNVVISNVRGPAQPVDVAGQPVCDLISVGPLDIGVALNITVWSYAGKLNFTVLACPAQLPDAHVVTEALQDAFVDLRRALGGA
jgi:diacylglycerol O-acyltransferase / wax synthase